jgi:hypothetical protein
MMEGGEAESVNFPNKSDAHQFVIFLFSVKKKPPELF